MKNAEIKQMGNQERDEKLRELNTELMKLRSQASTGTAQKGSGRIRAARRMIARILTLQKQGGTDK